MTLAPFPIGNGDRDDRHLPIGIVFRKSAGQITMDETGGDMDSRKQAPGVGSSGINAVVLTISIATSLILTTTVNRVAGTMLARMESGVGWIASAAIPSCIVILVLFLVLASPSVLRWKPLRAQDRTYIVRRSTVWLFVWLVGAALAAIVAGHWITYARSWPAVLAFLVFGPIGEELLFRGLIFEQARRLWSGTARPAIWISTISFSLHHIQLHAFPPQGIALAQIAFTVPMGIVFAQLRERSGSVWPAFLLHVATNVPAVF